MWLLILYRLFGRIFLLPPKSSQVLTLCTNVVVPVGIKACCMYVQSWWPLNIFFRKKGRRLCMKYILCCKAGMKILKWSFDQKWSNRQWKIMLQSKQRSCKKEGHYVCWVIKWPKPRTRRSRRYCHCNFSIINRPLTYIDKIRSKSLHKLICTYTPYFTLDIVMLVEQGSKFIFH